MARIHLRAVDLFLRADADTAKDLVGQESFAVVLSDDVIAAETPCLRQLLDIHEFFGAPVLAVSDTLLMVPHVQTTCIVVRAAKTPRNAVNRALTLLSATHVRPAGIVLNRLPRRRGAGYYYYYASHGYGDGGTYGRSYGRDRGPTPARIATGNGADGEDGEA